MAQRKRDMSRHTEQESATPEEIERWQRAAKVEGVTYQEFTRRAMQERASNILSPGNRLLGGIFESTVRLLAKQPVIEAEKFCQCGHSRHHHAARSGSDVRAGSCGNPHCNCKRFVEGKV